MMYEKQIKRLRPVFFGIGIVIVSIFSGIFTGEDTMLIPGVLIIILGSIYYKVKENKRR